MVLADVHELPSMRLSRDLMHPSKLAQVKQSLDEGKAIIYAAFAATHALQIMKGSLLARILSGKSQCCFSSFLATAGEGSYKETR
jgi:hypothetical protein